MQFKTDIGTQLNNESALKKDKTSIFILTINPNISSTPGTSFHKTVHEKLMGITKVIFGDAENFSEIVKFRDPTHSFCDKYIKSVELIPTIEYGRLKKWHLNAYIKICHQSNIQLDREKLIDLYAEGIGVDKKAIHIDIGVEGVARRSEDRMKNYVLKNRAQNE